MKRLLSGLNHRHHEITASVSRLSKKVREKFVFSCFLFVCDCVSECDFVTMHPCWGQGGNYGDGGGQS